jgi:hypothetical protein
MAEAAKRLAAVDVWPIAKKLPRDEQLQLARLLLRQAATSLAADGEAYAAAPPGEEEFTSDEDVLDWEGEGWEEFYATR